MNLIFKPVATIALSAIATSWTVAFPTIASAFTLGDYNLVVFEDLISNSEVEGNAFIGGNLLGSSSNYCIHCSAGGSFEPSDGVGLKVVGNIEGNPKQINNGTDLEYGGLLNSTVNMNGGGSKTQNSDLASEFSQLKNFLTGTSTQLSGLASNSSVIVPGTQPGAVKFNGSGDDIAIFNIDASQLFSDKTQQIELNLNGSGTAIINVSGTFANWTQGNIVGGLTGDSIQQKVLWNFYEAETLTFNNALHGSLLAPLAHLTNQTELEGSVVVKSFDQRGEVHLPVFTGSLPASETATEPTTAEGPTEPTTAEGPTEPTTAEGPTEPTTAEGPTEPTTAEGPTEPTTAEGPTEPTTAEGPTEPTTAEGPTEPTTAEGPTEPTTAEGPTEPTTAEGPTDITTAESTEIPEPSTLAGLFLAMGGFFASRRRKAH